MRRNDHDVTDRVRTTDAAAVGAEVLHLYHSLYPRASAEPIRRAFEHALRLYRGCHPDYHGCDTPFHDTQHVLEVTLAMARLMDGYERGRAGRLRLPAALYSVGVIGALFHDVGYLRRRSDRRHAHGAEYTLTHVGRSAQFLHEYLRGTDLTRYAPVAAGIVHYTGHERRAETIRVDGELPRRIGQMLGTADLIAQMADRCYIEKRRDRLYPELLAGGIAARLFRSAGELVRRTHAFQVGAMRRLDLQLARAYEYAGRHFGGQNLYLDAMQQNAGHARLLLRVGEDGRLRRAPPALAAHQ
ncbi:MAG: hypothetical protein OEZ09_13515 [Betaproteobacteria bacterium]|nr:hypothetical protein [Betaproteobacteria bacterium]MDH5579460.1 hypothetical protein [Betaproteobacteria bacterium]